MHKVSASPGQSMSPAGGRGTRTSQADELKRGRYQEKERLLLAESSDGAKAP